MKKISYKINKPFYDAEGLLRCQYHPTEIAVGLPILMGNYLCPSKVMGDKNTHAITTLDNYRALQSTLALAMCKNCFKNWVTKFPELTISLLAQQLYSWDTGIRAFTNADDLITLSKFITPTGVSINVGLERNLALNVYTIDKNISASALEKALAELSVVRRPH